MQMIIVYESKERIKKKKKKKRGKRGLVCLTSFAGELKAALHWKPKSSSGGGC